MNYVEIYKTFYLRNINETHEISRNSATKKPRKFLDYEKYFTTHSKYSKFFFVNFTRKKTPINLTQEKNMKRTECMHFNSSGNT